MVTGTLYGKPTPWFDQIMAWNFDQDGKISKTVFWSDSLFWHKLYQKYAAKPAAETLMATGISNGFPSSAMLYTLMCLVFASGVLLGGCLGSQYGIAKARQDSKEMHYLRIA